MNVALPPLHAAEVSEVYGVFLFALFTKDHLVPGYIREHAIHEEAAIRAVDVTHGQSGYFVF